jgi:hypothetical protein
MEGRTMSVEHPRLRIIAAGLVIAALAVLIAAAAPPRMSQPHPAPAQPSHPATMPSSPSTPAAMPSMGLTPGQFMMLRSLPSLYNGMRSLMPSSAMGAYGSGMSMYGSGYGGGMSMSRGNSGQGSGSQVAGAQQEQGETEAERSEQRTISQVLSAAGVPNTGGQMIWPVGLRILPNPRATELRQQIDALVQLAAEQSAAGPVNAQLNRELGSAVDSLSKLLYRDREERFSLPSNAYEDAEAFLAKLKHAQVLLSGGLASPEGKTQLKTQKNKYGGGAGK